MNYFQRFSRVSALVAFAEATFVFACLGSHATAPDPAALNRIAALSVPFVPNAGQWDARAAFAAQTFAGTLFVTKEGQLVYSLPGKPIAEDATARRDISPAARNPHDLHRRPVERTPGWVLSETLVDGKGRARPMSQSTLQAPAGYRPMQASVSYLIGNDETKHAKALNTYERVNLGDMYPGINVQLRATGNNIEKIFTVAPRQDATQINIWVNGANTLELGAQGELIVNTGNGPVTFTAPIAFQETASGERRAVRVAYALNSEPNTTSTSYRFTLGDYDRSQPLVIDPLLRSTYLGAAGLDYATALAVHPGSGDVYVAGTTSSTTNTFPGVSGGAQAALGGLDDAFVSRFSADLNTLIKSTYLGAAGFDQANAIAIHPGTGDIYVAGFTDSTTSTFPGVSGGAQGSLGGTYDAFVTRLSADLTTLIKSTYLGAAATDFAYALAIHPASGDVYVAGYTTSATTSFPGVSGGAQGASGGGTYDAFVSRFSADLTTLIKSTYLGAAAADYAYALAIHPVSGDVYVAGNTTSTTTSFPGVSGSAQTTTGGANDAFITRFSADLTTLIKSSYLGAAGSEFAYALAIHPASGDVYVAGSTTSPSSTFPGTSGGAQGTSGGGTYDAFISRFSADLSTLFKSTYLGATSPDYATALAIHPTSGEVYVTGYTSSSASTFPGVSGGAQGVTGGADDAFVSRFSADLTTLVKSTYLGAAAPDYATALTIHPTSGEIYVAGYTNATASTFPGVSGGAQGSSGGGTDAFVSRFSANLSKCDLDIDRDNAVRASTDGLLILRRMLGLSGAALIANAVNPVGSQTGDVAIANAIDALLTTLDVDGSGVAADAASDGLLLLRAMLGFTGSAVTTGAISGTPSRNTWALIRSYLNSNCGTIFQP